MYLGSLAAIRSSQGGLRSDALGGRGFCSVAAQRAMFLVPGCFAKQPGKVCHSFPFLPPFFHLLILTMYLGSLDATRSSQGGLRSDMLRRRGFRSLAACAAARGVVYSVPRSAGVVFGPRLLCEAAREGLPFLSLLLSFFSLIYITMYLGSLAAMRSSQGGLQSYALGGRGFRPVAACAAARGGCLQFVALGGRGFWFLAALRSS